MDILEILLVAGAVFGLCALVDKGFTRLFRSKAQHRSGMAVRLNSKYGAAGVILMVLGIVGVFAGLPGNWIVLAGGGIVIVMGLCLAVAYLSFGIFYDEESFLVARFGRKSQVCRYKEIEKQQLYVTSGNVVIELFLTEGRSVQLHRMMTGVDDFLDKAFAGWCAQRGIDPETCGFHDPEQNCWFPPAGE